MNALFNSFWRAAVYCLHPRVIALSLLPLGVMVVLALGLGYLLWQPALDAVRAAFESWAFLAAPMRWLENMGWSSVATVLAPIIVVALSTPVIVVVSLLLVAAFMTPAMVTLVATRRFAPLERKHGGSFLASMFGALWATLVALLALLLSIPLWFVPPLVLILPPLIWGWLTYRVMSYDVLAEHASSEERAELIRRHRTRLLGIGVVTGYLGAAPSLVWASGALFVVLAPVLVPLAVWIYTLVFAFSSLWFAHFALSALQALRAERSIIDALPVSPQAAPLVTLDAASPNSGPPSGAAGTPPTAPWNPP